MCVQPCSTTGLLVREQFSAALQNNRGCFLPSQRCSLGKPGFPILDQGAQGLKGHRTILLVYRIMSRSRIRHAARCCAALVKTLLMFLLAEHRNARRSNARSVGVNGPLFYHHIFTLQRLRNGVTIKKTVNTLTGFKNITIHSAQANL